MNQPINSIAILMALGTITAWAQQSPELPVSISSGSPTPLLELVDQDFQKGLSAKLNSNPKWKGLIAQKKMAVGLVDLRNLDQIKFARVNGNNMMYAASLPKIGILLAIMENLESGELKETPQILNDLRLMISKSDNPASTRLIDLLGYQRIEAVLTDPKYELYDEEYGGGLWVGKRYAKTGARYPDPLRGISHGATASQVCRFYYLLVMGKLVSFDRSRQMLDIMADPELHHKFVNTLDQIAPKADLYRKSGSWKNFHSDSILVWGPNRQYILVALVEDPAGENIIRQLVLAVEEVLKSAS